MGFCLLGFKPSVCHQVGRGSTAVFVYACTHPTLLPLSPPPPSSAGSPRRCGSGPTF